MRAAAAARLLPLSPRFPIPRDGHGGSQASPGTGLTPCPERSLAWIPIAPAAAHPRCSAGTEGAHRGCTEQKSTRGQEPEADSALSHSPADILWRTKMAAGTWAANIHPSSPQGPGSAALLLFTIRQL